MTEFETQGFQSEAALRSLQGAATETADTIDQAFARAGESLARSLARAAADGRISLKELASAVLAAVNSASGVSGSVSGGVSGLGAVLSEVFAGARADGGPVLPGGAYLVGERGPEIFRPGTAGTIEAGAAPNVTVTLNVSGGAGGLIRSEAQLASALNRAARMGLR